MPTTYIKGDFINGYKYYEPEDISQEELTTLKKRIFWFNIAALIVLTLVFAGLVYVILQNWYWQMPFVANNRLVFIAKLIAIVTWPFYTIWFNVRILSYVGLNLIPNNLLPIKNYKSIFHIGNLSEKTKLKIMALIFGLYLITLLF